MGTGTGGRAGRRGGVRRLRWRLRGRGLPGGRLARALDSTLGSIRELLQAALDAHTHFFRLLHIKEIQPNEAVLVKPGHR